MYYPLQFDPKVCSYFHSLCPFNKKQTKNVCLWYLDGVHVISFHLCNIKCLHLKYAAHIYNYQRQDVHNEWDLTKYRCSKLSLLHSLITLESNWYFRYCTMNCKEIYFTSKHNGTIKTKKLNEFPSSIS